MDKSRKRGAAPTELVRGRGGLVNPRIGIIGRATLTPKETGVLWYIGRCLARLGHTTVVVPAQGTADAIREGVKVEEGSLAELPKGVIENSDRTLIYPDAALLERLQKAYPDLATRKDVVVITEDNLDEWYDAVRQVMLDKGLALPE